MVGHTCNPSILDAEFSRYIVYLRPVSGYTRRFYQKTIKKEKKRIEESKKTAGWGEAQTEKGKEGSKGAEGEGTKTTSLPA